MFVLVARARRRDDLSAWVAVGTVTGVGLENKYTLGLLLVGVFVGLALARRDALRRPGPWVLGVPASGDCTPRGGTPS